MHPFAYHRAISLADAVARRRADGEARFLAGGQSVLPALKMRLAEVSELIDLRHLPELKRIVREPGGIAIGAAATHAEVAEAPAVRAAIPALAELAGAIGDPLVRNLGTLGGSLANNDPAADYPAALLALGASVRTDRRSIAADQFILGMFETALAEDELIVAVDFPAPERAAYMRFRNPASGYPIVGVFVARFTGGGVRVAVTGAGPAAFRVAEMEKALARSFAPAAIAGIVVPSEGLNADLHADADYRAHLVGVLARRAVAAAGA